MTRGLSCTVERVCDGACASHDGEVVRVVVAGWGEFDYCQEAIREDRRRGLIVEVEEGEAP